MKKLLLGLAITLATLSTPFKAVEAQPHLNISCENYGLKTMRKYLTQDYVYFFCWDTSVHNHYGQTYYYLGGMRKGNTDHFILLPIEEWGDGYFSASNNGYRYVNSPPCYPGALLNECYPAQPQTFTIYKGNTIIDRQVVGATASYN